MAQLPAVGAAGMVPVTVKPVAPPKPLTYFERLGNNWPLNVPARPPVSRAVVPLALLGTVEGDKPCAVVWDGTRSRIVEEGSSLTIQGSKIFFREIGKGYAQVVCDHRVRTLKLREGA
jgi:hypothetical protein